MQCPQCVTELIPGKRFCHTCGMRVSRGCRTCGAAVGEDFQFCADCGTPLSPGSAPTVAAPQAATTPAGDARLRHLPEALAGKLRSAVGGGGERKRVTVLFCDLAGSTAIAESLDPEVFREVLDRYFALTIEEVSRFEGLVNQLAGDGLMALFGAPIAHEDEPERAVRAALAIQEKLVGLSATLEDELGFPLEARIGIHTGTVVTGTIGTDLKMDYTAIGDTTNLASRLQGLARPGTVLISDATARLVEGRFELHRLSPFEVRGKSGRIVAHEVVGASVDAVSPMEIAKARGLTPLVGRSAELEQLEACFERLDRGLSQIVEVVGPAGSGKSRLLYEFRRLIEPRQPIVFEGRCSALGRTTPYGVWEGMLRSFVSASRADAPEEVLEKVRRKLLEPGLTTPGESPYLSRFLDVTNEAIAAEPGEVTGQRISSAYGKMLFRAAEKGRLVILLEDLQWIDDASQSGLEEVLWSIESVGVMLVVTHRPDYEHDWQSSGAVTRLRLRSMTAEEATDVLRAVVGGQLPATLEARVVERAEGNPFFLEEVARKLLADGAIDRTSGRPEVTRAVEEVEIPATVHELMTARLDHVRPAAKRVAQVAAVVGRQFDAAILSDLVADEEIDVATELAELERAGIVHRKHTGGQDEYRFGESFTQEVAYDSLLLRERRRLHDQIGVQLARQSDRPLANPNAQVGRHFARGNDPERGIEALLRAGEQAEAIPSYGDAIGLYREAWALAEAALRETARPGPDLQKWALRAAYRLTNLAVMYGAAHGNLDDSAALRGIELAKSIGDTETLSRLYASQGMFIMNQGRDRFGEGLGAIQEGLTVARAGGHETAEAALKRVLSFAYLLDGRLSDARREIDATIDELERLGQKEALSDTFMGARFFRYRVLYESDELDEAGAYSRETLQLAEKARNRTIESSSAAGLATLSLMRAEYEQTIEWATRGLDVALAIENVGAARSAAAVRVLAQVSLGRGLGLGGEAETIQRGLLTSGDLAINVDLLVAALCSIGHVGRARKLAEMAIERSGGRLRDARHHLALGIAFSSGHGADPCRAYTAYSHALDVGEEVGSRSIVGRAHLGRAHLGALRGEHEHAEEEAVKALALLEEVGFTRYTRLAQSLLTTARAREDRAAPELSRPEP